MIDPGPRRCTGVVRLLGAVLLGVVLTAAPQAQEVGGDELLTLGSYAAGDEPEVPRELRVVGYNLHGPPTKRIEAMIEALRTHPVLSPAPILLLQEVNRDHAGSGNKDIVRELAQALKMHFAYAVEIEHEKGGGVRGLAILSRFPIEDVERVLLPVKGPGGRRRIALGASIRLGDRRLRVYTTHLETRISVDNRAKQIQGIVDAARKYDGLPTAILGDFNTFTSGATKRMFSLMQEAGYACPLKGDKKTFRAKFIARMKLDWIWLKGVEALRADVEAKVKVSDHRPLWVDLDWAVQGAGGVFDERCVG